jgi:soluble lytic murein transglycosylase-like protein
MRYLVVAACIVLLAVLANPADSAVNWQFKPTAEDRLRAENARLRRANTKLGQRVRSLHRALRFDYEITNAVKLASIVYGVPRSLLWRKMWCESKGWPFADNPTSDASGLFQFMPSTYRSTPFSSVSLWDPYANALAAGYMHRVGRGGEWECA